MRFVFVLLTLFVLAACSNAGVELAQNEAEQRVNAILSEAVLLSDPELAGSEVSPVNVDENSLAYIFEYESGTRVFVHKSTGLIYCVEAEGPTSGPCDGSYVIMIMRDDAKYTYHGLYGERFVCDAGGNELTTQECELIEKQIRQDKLELTNDLD